MSDRGNIGVIFDGSFDGFLSIIHSFYYNKLNPSCIVDEQGFQQSLGTQYKTIATDAEKARTVAASIQQKISPDTLNTLHYALLNKEPARYMDMLNYTVAGFKLGKEINNYLKWDFVMKVQKYAKNTGGEAHLLKGFTRFKSTKEGVFYAEITPENNVLGILSEHFSQRLMNERWILHDKRRHLASIYDTHQWAVYEVPSHAEINITDDEYDYQDLWNIFVDSIAVEHRVSKKRQRQLLPYRYRGNMTEFNRTK